MKEQIKQAFEKVTGRGLDDYEWDLPLEGDDLGMDGLDFVEFIMCLEAQLQISIPDDTAEALATPNQWLVYLNSILKESTPSTEQESQEEIWNEAQLRIKNRLGTYSNDLVSDLARWAVEVLKDEFIITRKS